MAIIDTNLVWSAGRALGVTHVERLILLRIADRANAVTGIAWPGVRSLARECGVTLGYVSKAVNSLIQKNLLVVTEPATRSRSRRLRVNRELLAAIVGGQHSSDPLSDTPEFDTVEQAVRLIAPVAFDPVEQNHQFNHQVKPHLKQQISASRYRDRTGLEFESLQKEIQLDVTNWVDDEGGPLRDVTEESSPF